MAMDQAPLPVETPVHVRHANRQRLGGIGIDRRFAVFEPHGIREVTALDGERVLDDHAAGLEATADPTNGQPNFWRGRNVSALDDAETCPLEGHFSLRSCCAATGWWPR